MGIQPTEGKALTLAEYGGLLHHWNAAQSGEEADLEPPDLDTLAERRRRLEAQGVKVLH